MPIPMPEMLEIHPIESWTDDDFHPNRESSLEFVNELNNCVWAKSGAKDNKQILTAEAAELAFDAVGFFLSHRGFSFSDHPDGMARQLEFFRLSALVHVAIAFSMSGVFKATETQAILISTHLRLIVKDPASDWYLGLGTSHGLPPEPEKWRNNHFVRFIPMIAIQSGTAVTPEVLISPLGIFLGHVLHRRANGQSVAVITQESGEGESAKTEPIGRILQGAKPLITYYAGELFCWKSNVAAHVHLSVTDSVRVANVLNTDLELRNILRHFLRTRGMVFQREADQMDRFLDEIQRDWGK